MEESWKIETSVASMSTKNLLRILMNNVLNYTAPDDKPLISIAIGDPTKYDNLPVPISVKQALKKLPNMTGIHSYIGSAGKIEARQAILTLFEKDMNNECVIDDVFVCCGCTQSLEICIYSLLNANSNDFILIPRPGFGVYQAICQKYSLKYKLYDCNPSKNWEIDVENIREILINNPNMNIRAILINNPSNPWLFKYKYNLLFFMIILNVSVARNFALAKSLQQKQTK